MREEYLDPLNAPDDAGRRELLKRGGKRVGEASKVAGTLALNKVLDDALHPSGATAWGKLPTDTRESLKLMTGLGTLSPIDREVATKFGSPKKLINNLVADETIDRRGALKAIGAVGALAPAGLAPAARLNSLTQALDIAERSPANLRGLRDAAALKLMANSDKMMNSEVKRRDFLKGLMAVIGGRFGGRI